MDSTRLAKFLYQRIQETIDHIQYISNVKISYNDLETFGNEYISVNYNVEVNAAYYLLDINKQKDLFQGTSSYTFTLSTNKGKHENGIKNKILRILEFRYVYESLASYAALQFEKYSHPGFTTHIKPINFWPVANYIEGYLIKTLDKKTVGWYSSIYDIEQHTSQWSRLHELARTTARVKEKAQFSITDIEISHLFNIDLNSIREILLDGEVPIKISGVKTIESISIHVVKLIDALKKKIKKVTSATIVYTQIIEFLYDEYFPSDKASIIKQQQVTFLNLFIIQAGDVVRLKNEQIVMVDTVTIAADNAIKIKYAVIKTNLEKSERTKEVEVENIAYILKKEKFLKYVSNIRGKHSSLLKKWMVADGIKLDFEPFMPNLTK